MLLVKVKIELSNEIKEDILWSLICVDEMKAMDVFINKRQKTSSL